MDRDFLIQQLGQFIFTLASNGPVVFLGTLGILVFGLGPIGRGIARRIATTEVPPLPAEDPAAASLKATVAELQERLDFSERVLADLRERPDAANSPHARRLQRRRLRFEPLELVFRHNLHNRSLDVKAGIAPR